MLALSLLSIHKHTQHFVRVLPQGFQNPRGHVVARLEMEQVFFIIVFFLFKLAFVDDVSCVVYSQEAAFVGKDKETGMDAIFPIMFTVMKDTTAYMQGNALVCTYACICAHRHRHTHAFTNTYTHNYI